MVAWIRPSLVSAYTAEDSQNILLDHENSTVAECKGRQHCCDSLANFNPNLPPIWYLHLQKTSQAGNAIGYLNLCGCLLTTFHSAWKSQPTLGVLLSCQNQNQVCLTRYPSNNPYEWLILSFCVSLFLGRLTSEDIGPTFYFFNSFQST